MMERWTGTCDATGKRMYPTRDRAKNVARQHSRPRPSAYRCDACEYFHLGHNAGLSRADHRGYHGGAA